MQFLRKSRKLELQLADENVDMGLKSDLRRKKNAVYILIKYNRGWGVNKV